MGNIINRSGPKTTDRSICFGSWPYGGPSRFYDGDSSGLPIYSEGRRPRLEAAKLREFAIHNFLSLCLELGTHILLYFYYTLRKNHTGSVIETITNRCFRPDPFYCSKLA